MQRTKLTVRVQQDLLENIKRYAAENNTTLTDLINSYLQHILAQGSLDNAPIVQRLSGIMSTEVSTQDYRRYLEEKYAK